MWRHKGVCFLQVYLYMFMNYGNMLSVKGAAIPINGCPYCAEKAMVVIKTVSSSCCQNKSRYCLAPKKEPECFPASHPQNTRSSSMHHRRKLSQNHQLLSGNALPVALLLTVVPAGYQQGCSWPVSLKKNLEFHSSQVLALYEICFHGC